MIDDVRDLKWIKIGFAHQAEVIEELRCRRSRDLQIPSFIEYSMMASFDDTSVDVDITDVVTGSHETHKDTSKVVRIQFGTAVATAFNTNP